MRRLVGRYKREIYGGQGQVQGRTVYSILLTLVFLSDVKLSSFTRLRSAASSLAQTMQYKVNVTGDALRVNQYYVVNGRTMQCSARLV